VKNIHQRHFEANSADLGRWITRLWSGTEDDCFPRDYIPTWRKTDGIRDADQLIAGRTSLGHGPFSFTFQQWDGKQWRVTVERRGMAGWHGFDLIPESNGTRLVHTIELRLQGAPRLIWPVLVEPVHNWAVEAIFDRIEEALKTGVAPRSTKRRMAIAPRLAFAALKLIQRKKARSR
jgi:hypothetical protein